MVQVGFRGKFEHAVASLRHICKHKEVFPASRLSHVQMLQVAAHLFWIVIQKGLCVYETRVNEIKLYSRFKRASDYR